MKVIGTITTVNTYIFSIASRSSGSTVRIDVYSRYSDMNDAELLPILLGRAAVEQFNSYLLGSAVISSTGLITSYYGSYEVISTVIKQLQATGDMPRIVSGSIEPGVYHYSTGTVDIALIDVVSGYKAKLKGLDYVPVKTYHRIREVAVGNSQFKVRTFEEVIRDHDMSWYFDEKGICKKDYRLIQSVEELREVMNDAASYSYMSFDTETTGVDFYWFKGDRSKRSKICGLSLSWRDDQGIYVPFMSNVFTALDLDECMEILYPIMRSKQIICHNGMFDFKVLYSYGYYIPIAHDTLLMEFNINPEVKKNSKGLKTLTRKYLNHETIELDELTGGTVIPELIPYVEKRLMEVYACSDSDYTLKLFKLLYKHLKNRPSYKLDTKLIDILAVAEYQGAPINMTLLDTMSKINKRDMERVEALMNRYLRLAGTQSLAVKAIRAYNQEGYTPSYEEINELCHYKPFLDSIEPAFLKQTDKTKDKNKPLQFSAAADVSYILYDLLEYPVVKTNVSGSRTSDKEALNRLMEYTATDKIEFLKDDVYTSAQEFGVDSHDILISKSKFEGYKYPFAYLLTVWRKLQKFDSSFFGPLQAESSTGYYYTDNSMTSAETGRVINKIQTLEGSLKELIVPRDDEWYMIVFDKSQIEFRVMLGLAATYWNELIKSNALPEDVRAMAKDKNLDALIERLNDWEKDYHREGGAIFAGCTPDTMTNKQRKKVKAIHFSVPYGAEAASVAKPRLAGHPESEWGEIIAETEADLSAWRNKLYPLYYYLEHVRDVALTPLKENPPLLNGPHGMVKNAMGRYRLFDLEDMSFKAQSAIRRQAGNYPIQSLARDIFFSGVYKLYSRLMQEGIISEDFEKCKAVLNIFVHDEVVLQVHKSIHPYRMYKYIMETNLTKLEGHPTYFMGIAVADTWGKGKTDSYEAPIDYVYECVSEYENNQDYYDNIAQHVNSLAALDYTKLCWDGITDWFARRACRELAIVQQGSDLVNPRTIHDRLLNYYVKPRLPFYTQPCRKPEYQIDHSLPVDSKDTKYNGYIKLFDYYLLITGEYKKYKLLFEGKEIPYSEILMMQEKDSADDFVDLDDLDFDSFPLLSEQDEDYAEKESAFAEEAYLLDEQHLVIDLSSKNTLVDKQEEEKEIYPQLWGYDPDGSVVFFVSGLTELQFKHLVQFLKMYVSQDGKPLYFFNTHKVYSKANINVTFSAEQVYKAVYGDTPVKTSYFGGK